MTGAGERSLRLCIGSPTVPVLRPGTLTVVVEAHPGRLPALRRLAREAPERLRLIEATIAAASSDGAEYRCLSVEELSGPADISGLKALMPGLGIVETVQVAALSPADLFRREDLSSPLRLGDEHTLEIALPAVEGSILSALRSLDLLGRFSTIRAWCASRALAADSMGAADISELMAAEGFRASAISADDDNDPDLPVLSFQRDTPLHTVTVALRKAKADLANQRTRFAAQADALRTAVAGKDAEIAQLGQHISVLERERDAGRANADREKAAGDEARAALERAHEDLAGVRSQSEARAEALAAVETRAEADRIEAAAQADALRTAVAGKDAEIAQLGRHISVLERERDADRANADREKAAGDEARAALERAHEDLAGVRSQSEARAEALAAAETRAEADRIEAAAQADALRTAVAGKDAEIAQLGQHISVLERERDAGRANADREKAAGDEARAALERAHEDLAGVRSQSEARAEALASAEALLEETRTGFAEERSAFGAANAEKDAAIAQLGQHISVLEHERDVARRNADREKAAGDEARAALDEAQRKIGALEDALQDSRNDTNRSRRDLGASLRLQGLLQADLRDLQSRHADTIRGKEEQEALICQLAQRLGEASEWLRSSDAGGELLPAPGRAGRAPPFPGVTPAPARLAGDVRGKPRKPLANADIAISDASGSLPVADTVSDVSSPASPRKRAPRDKKDSPAKIRRRKPG